ncbi:MAG: hypothetical protein HQL69_06840 [Magnetococcales bacterium]|nr:hypothetical protein [Magnetococcales bacterium]
MLGFLLLAVVLMSWVFYQIGSATAVLKRARFVLKQDIAQIKKQKDRMEDMLKDVEKSYEQKLAQYDALLKEEREQRRGAMEVKWDAYKEARVEIVDKEVARIKVQKLDQIDLEMLEIKKQNIEQLKAENLEKKQAAVDSLNAWIEKEKSRLQSRLDSQYEQKIKELKGSLESKVLLEVEQVAKQTAIEKGTVENQLKGEIAGLVKSVTHDVVKGIQ